MMVPAKMSLSSSSEDTIYVWHGSVRRVVIYDVLASSEEHLIKSVAVEDDYELQRIVKYS